MNKEESKTQAMFYSISLYHLPTDKISFRYSNSTLIIRTLNSKNRINHRWVYRDIFKNKALRIKSVIIYDKSGKKQEFFLHTDNSIPTYNPSEIHMNIKMENLDIYLANEITHITFAKNISKNYLTINGEKVIKLKNDNNNIIIGENSSNAILGSERDDIIIGGDASDNISGLLGNDTIIGKKGNDSLFGEEGNDILVGGEGNDGLAGGPGNDILYGGDGNDELHGDAEALGCFAVEGKARGNDIIFGGNGNDRIEGERNNDYLAGGTGDDLYVFSYNDGINLIVEYSNEGNIVAINDHYFHELAFSRYGTHLMISSTRIGNSLVIVIKDQFAEDGYKIKHLQTKSYIYDGDRKQKENLNYLLNKLIKENTDNPLKKLESMSKYSYSDLGDHFNVILPDAFGSKMPDIETTTENKLVNELRDRNEKLVRIYNDNPSHFGENLPDITYLTEALSSFSPKDAPKINTSLSKSDMYSHSLANRLALVYN